MTYLDQQREEKMITMANPQPLRISRTAKLTLPRATSLLLLGVVALFLLAAPPRPAEALPLNPTQSLAPTLRVEKSSVVVSEEETVTNTGNYDDMMDKDFDTVRVSASMGTVTQGGTITGPWHWAIEFRDNSGLTDTFVEKPDPMAVRDIADRVDYIYYRGPYSVYQTQLRMSESLIGQSASDHPYVFTHLLRDY